MLCFTRYTFVNKKQPLKNLFILLIALSTLFISCSKEKTVTPPGIAGLVVFNLAPDQQKLMVTIDGNYFTGVPLSYSKYSGKYNGVYEGSRSVIAFDQSSNLDLAKNNFTFRDSAFYSLFFVGYNKNYLNLIVEDHLSSLPKSTGKSFVRYLYGIPDSLGAHVSIADGTSSIFDEQSSFCHISEFKQTEPGTVQVSVKNNSGTIDATRHLSLDADGIYTIILQGTTQSLDTGLSVKINMVKNGIAK